MGWLISRGSLTHEQLRVVESGWDCHRLVLGSPGSGKTLAALHRAKHLVEENGTPADRFRLLVYTGVLKAYISAALGELDLPENCVTTFDSWCRDYYRNKIDSHLPWSKPNRTFDWEAIRGAVWERTRSRTHNEEHFEFVIVDEGQDLDRRDYETLAAVSRHITVFMDPKQKLYRRDADELGVAKVLGLQSRNLSLLDAYRCSPHIVQLGAKFVQNSAERDYFVEQNSQGFQGQRQLPHLYLAEDADDERRHLINVLRTRMDRGGGERIGILFPTIRHVFGYARALTEAGLLVEVKVRSNRKKKKGTPPAIDFGSTAPKLMPFPSAKGLTFDTVIMPRFNRRFFGRIGEALLERWVFVGITRATKWVCISTTDGENTLFMERFAALEKRQNMAITRGSSTVVSVPDKKVRSSSKGGKSDPSSWIG